MFSDEKFSYRACSEQSPPPLSISLSAFQEFSGSSPKRRRAEEKDEGIGSPDALEEEKGEELRREMLELRQQLDKERSARILLEEQVRGVREWTLKLAERRFLSCWRNRRER